jgi:hypothetical protein
MALLQLTNAAATASANALLALIDVGTQGKINIRTGAMPATADTAASGTILCTLLFPDPAFPTAVNGVGTANVIAQVASIASGVAGHFEVTDSSNVVIFRGDVTASGGGGSMELVTTTITSPQPVQITSFTYTQPKS